MTQTQELEKQTESLVVRAEKCNQITTAEQYTSVVELGRALRAMNITAGAALNLGSQTFQNS